MAPMAMAIPPSDMMLEVTPIAFIGMKAIRTVIGMVKIGIKALGMCQRKDQNHQADDGDFLEERVLQRVNRAQNEFGPVIGGNDLHAGRQRGLNLIKFGLHAVNHAQGVFAGAHDHHPAHRVALAVQVRNAAANVRAQRDLANVLHRDGHTAPRIAAHHDAPQVVK